MILGFLMKKYNHVFFDLDHTLWDFEKNSLESLADLYKDENLKALGIDDLNYFTSRYHFHNTIYWEQYQRGEINRDTLRYIRFHSTLQEYQIDDTKKARELAEKYLAILPTKKNLFFDTIEVLDYLKPKYSLHILSNGFAETQHKKLQNAGIENYFRYIITSEKAGYQKPERGIFDYALQLTNATKDDCIFIGDDLFADMFGAKNAGWDHVFYNPGKKKHSEKFDFEIHSLSELKKIL
jgi:putative hydrolase of the HAD superfamily